MRRKFILDVDTDVDDAQALMLALSRPDVDVIAITCVSGNVHVDQVCLNTLKVLEVCDSLEIPVYKGADRPLCGEGFEAIYFHGNDGLGDARLHSNVSMDQIQKEHAVTALLRLSKKYQGEITLVALAPLTNIALAIRQDPQFGARLKHATIMGGNTQGIITKWFDRWLETDTHKGRFLKSITPVSINYQRYIHNLPYFFACDLNAMAATVDASLVTSSEHLYATVELQGRYTRGMMVVDWNQHLGKPPNITMALSLDTERSSAYFEQMVTSFKYSDVIVTYVRYSGAPWTLHPGNDGAKLEQASRETI